MQHDENPQPQPRKRKRKSHSTLHEGEGEGWAVSYSDMLMVLMSFFIIFYNADDAKGKGEAEQASSEPSVVENLVKEIQAKGLMVEVDPETGEPVKSPTVGQGKEKNIGNGKDIGVGDKANIGDGEKIANGSGQDDADIEKQMKAEEINMDIDPNTGEVVKREQVVKTTGEEQVIKGFPKDKGEEKKDNALSRNITSFFYKNKREGNKGFGNEEGLGLGKRLGDDIGVDEAIDGVTFTRIEPEEIKKDGKWNRILKQTNDGSQYKGGILIDFKDDIYDNGKFELTIEAMADIKKVLDLVEPYKDKINIVFIGHADSVPILGKNVINSNMILSTLRAAKAVEFAIDRGFDFKWVSSQGLSKNDRNTRSLSIRIMER